MKRKRTSLWAAVMGAGLMAVSAQAANITLSTPFQAGDYFVAANTNGDVPTFYHVRPGATAASTQVLYNSGLGSTENWIGGAFNHDTGDFFYWSGTDASHRGFELRKIAAGQTTSTQVIADMAVATNRSISSVAIASDNTVYAVQDNGVIRKFTPSGVNSYNAGSNLATNTNSTSGPGATIRIIAQGTMKDQYLILAPAAANPGNVDSVKTSDGSKTTVAGSGTNGPFNRPEGIAIDYNNTFGDGKLRVLVTSINAMDGTNRVTELAFDPTTGAISNPFSGGTGNLPINTNAEGVVKASSLIDQIQFDNDGNLVGLARYTGNLTQRLTPSQLYPESATLDLSSGTATWEKTSISPTTGFNAIRSIDIAPVVPEPAAMGLLALAGAVLGVRHRRSA